MVTDRFTFLRGGKVRVGAESEGTNGVLSLQVIEVMVKEEDSDDDDDEEEQGG